MCALLAEFFGGVPEVPAFVPVDAQAEQKKAIAGNLSALPGIEDLASKTNAFNQAELEKMYAQMLPGYETIKKNIGSNITAMTAGQIPQDVAEAVQRNAAVKSLYGGYSGTPAGRNLTARDLGLTSLNLTQKGLDSATRWMAATRAPQMDITSAFISPQFQAQFAEQERNAKFQHDYVENQWKWYGSFGQQAVRFEDSVVQLASSVAGAMAACWVAREVFGVGNPQWLCFRHWLMHHAPAWFRNLYLKFGKRFAAFIKDKPRVKTVIRRWMESKIKATPL